MRRPRTSPRREVCFAIKNYADPFDHHRGPRQHQKKDQLRLPGELGSGHEAIVLFRAAVASHFEPGCGTPQLKRFKLSAPADFNSVRGSTGLRMKPYSAILAAVAALLLLSAAATAQENSQRLILTGGGETIVLEPYAPNILRVTLSMDDAAAKAAPGYGIIAKPDAAGWTAERSPAQDVSMPIASSLWSIAPRADRRRNSSAPPARRNTSAARRHGPTSPSGRRTANSCWRWRLGAGRVQPQGRYRTTCQ